MKVNVKGVIKPLSQKELREIKNYTNKSFNTIGSENYKQKLVYNLLNTVKVCNQNEFFSVILRTLNTQKGNESAKKLCNELQKIHPLTPKNFENVAYSIIMGIMSAETEFGGN
jgi:hypothetical protein